MKKIVKFKSQWNEYARVACAYPSEKQAMQVFLPLRRFRLVTVN